MSDQDKGFGSDDKTQEIEFDLVKEDDELMNCMQSSMASDL